MTADKRRELALAVLGVAAAAGLALYASSRHWQVTTVSQPTPLPPKTISEAGTAMAPWLTAAGWVALAGAGALLATRRVGRSLVGAVISAAGVALLIGGLRGMTSDRWWWPLLTAFAGVAVAGLGAFALRSGRQWPAMGARYERATATNPARADPERPGDIWAALDRGEDPTANG